VLVGEGTESVGTEVDEGFHVVFGEAVGGYFGHMVHCVVVVSIVMSPGT